MSLPDDVSMAPRVAALLSDADQEKLEGVLQRMEAMVEKNCKCRTVQDLFLRSHF